MGRSVTEMDSRVLGCFIFLLSLVFGSGTLVEEQLFPSFQKELLGHEVEPIKTTSQFHVYNPMSLVPVINPTTPSTTTPVTNPLPTPTAPFTDPVTTPVVTPTTAPPTSTTAPPTSSGQSWCIASQSASQTALQVALDYACGYGGADCSATQEGGSCYNPNTVRDHASYAFNSYYQKNPVPTSCNFGGTAVITNADPSSGACRFPSSSTSTPVPNTPNPVGITPNPVVNTPNPVGNTPNPMGNTPTPIGNMPTPIGGATVFGSEPPDSTDSAALPKNSPLLLILTCLTMPVIVQNLL